MAARSRARDTCVASAGGSLCGCRQERRTRARRMTVRVLAASCARLAMVCFYIERLPDLVGNLPDQFELALLGVLADEVRSDGDRGEPALGGQPEPLAVDVAGRLVDACGEHVDRFHLGALARYQAENHRFVVGHFRQRLERPRSLVLVFAPK